MPMSAHTEHNGLAQMCLPGPLAGCSHSHCYSVLDVEWRAVLSPKKVYVCVNACVCVWMYMCILVLKKIHCILCLPQYLDIMLHVIP